MADWNQFTAFGNSLSADLLHHTLTPNGDRDWEADIMKFFRWIRAVRDDPAAHGIPEARSATVVELIEAFFPLPDDAQTRAPPIAVRDEIFPVNSQVRRARPLVVRFGPAHMQYSITDAPSALGYIFSVANPPANQAMTPAGYFLPMLALYAQCIYLAFVSINPGVRVFDNVPIMTCIMYGTVNGQVPAYKFGSTWSNTNKHMGNEETENAQRMLMMDVWRRRHAVDGSPAWVNPPPPLDPLPLLDPRTELRLASLMWSFFRGNFPPTMAVQEPAPVVEGFQTVIGGLRTLYDNAWRAGKTPPPVTAMISPASLYDNQRSSAALRRLLLALINLRLAPGYNAQHPPPEAAQGFQDLLHFFLTPHLYEADADGNLPPIGPGHPPAVVVTVPPGPDPVAQAVQVAWADAGTRRRAYACLNYIHQHFADVGFEGGRPFGRCAEAYPFTSMRQYFQGNAAPPGNVLRGLSLDTPVLGKSDVFGAVGSFTEGAVRGVNMLLREPCDVCKLVLGRLGVDRVNYDGDL